MNLTSLCNGLSLALRGHLQEAHPASISLTEVNHGYVRSDSGWATSGVASGYSRYSLNTLQFSEKLKNCNGNGH